MSIRFLSKAMEYNNEYRACCLSVVNSRVFIAFSIFKDNSGLSSIFSSDDVRHVSVSSCPQDTITEQHSTMISISLIREGLSAVSALSNKYKSNHILAENQPVFWVKSRRPESSVRTIREFF